MTNRIAEYKVWRDKRKRVFSENIYEEPVRLITRTSALYTISEILRHADFGIKFGTSTNDGFVWRQ